MNTLKKVFRKALPLLFWVAVWAVCYVAVGQDLLLASPVQVAKRFAFLGENVFWRCVGMSLWRTAAAYGLGVAVAVLLAAASSRP